MRVGIERIDRDDPFVDRARPGWIGHLGVAHHTGEQPGGVDVVEIRLQHRLSAVIAFALSLFSIAISAMCRVGVVVAKRDGRENGRVLEDLQRFVLFPVLDEAAGVGQLDREVIGILRREHLQGFHRSAPHFLRFIRQLDRAAERSEALLDDLVESALERAERRVERLFHRVVRLETLAVGAQQLVHALVAKGLEQVVDEDGCLEVGDRNQARVLKRLIQILEA